MQFVRDLGDTLPPDAVRDATLEVIKGVNRRGLILWGAVAFAIVVSTIGFWVSIATSTGADRSALLNAFIPLITLLVGGGGVAVVSARK